MCGGDSCAWMLGAWKRGCMGRQVCLPHTLTHTHPSPHVRATPHLMGHAMQDSGRALLQCSVLQSWGHPTGRPSQGTWLHHALSRHIAAHYLYQDRCCSEIVVRTFPTTPMFFPANQPLRSNVWRNIGGRVSAEAQNISHLRSTSDHPALQGDVDTHYQDLASTCLFTYCAHPPFDPEGQMETQCHSYQLSVFQKDALLQLGHHWFC